MFHQLQQFETGVINQLCIWLQSYRVHLPKQFTNKLDDRVYKELNKTNNLYEGLRDVTYPLVELHINSIFLYFFIIHFVFI